MAANLLYCLQMIRWKGFSLLLMACLLLAKLLENVESPII